MTSLATNRSRAVVSNFPEGDLARVAPLSGRPVSRPVALFFEWLVIPVRRRSPLAPGTLSEPPELYFKCIIAKTVIFSAAQLICAAADLNPGVLAHSVQFGT
jgi:hypothetical protein